MRVQNNGVHSYFLPASFVPGTRQLFFFFSFLKLPIDGERPNPGGRPALSPVPPRPQQDERHVVDLSNYRAVHTSRRKTPQIPGAASELASSAVNDGVARGRGVA
jgi:hypothetical protein